MKVCSWAERLQANRLCCELAVLLQGPHFIDLLGMPWVENTDYTAAEAFCLALAKPCHGHLDVFPA